MKGLAVLHAASERRRFTFALQLSNLLMAEALGIVPDAQTRDVWGDLRDAMIERYLCAVETETRLGAALREPAAWRAQLRRAS